MCIVYWSVDYATSTNTMGGDAGSMCPSRRTGRTICFRFSDILPVCEIRGVHVGGCQNYVFQDVIQWRFINLYQHFRGNFRQHLHGARREEQKVLPKSWCTCTKLHGVTSQKFLCYKWPGWLAWNPLCYHITGCSSIVPISNFLWPTIPIWTLWELVRWQKN